MSTATAGPGATTVPGTPEPNAPAPAKLTSVPKDIRNRILNGSKPVVPPPPEDDAAKAKKEADEKAAAEKVAADKKAADEKAAKEIKDKEEAKKKKPAKGPPLPEIDAAPTGNIPAADLTKAIRDILPELNKTNEPAPPKFSPEVEAEIKLAEFAEKQNPERYTGMAKKFTEFVISNDQLIAEKAKELGGHKSSEFKEFLESDEYRNFVDQNRPRYERGDKAKLQEAAIEARATDRVKREMEPKLQEIERKAREVEAAPAIRQAVTQVLTTVILVDPNEEKDPALEGFKKDMMKFGEEHPEEARLIAQTATEFTKRVETVLRVEAQIEEPDPAKSEDVRWIQGFMTHQNRAMAAQNPNGLQMPDGKILVDAETYEKRKLNKDPRYRTWTTTEMVGMIAAEGNAQVLKRLQNRRDGVLKSIYANPKPAPNGQPELETKPPEPEPSPEATTTRGSSGRSDKKPPESRARKYA
jgi:hypothetical protein